MEKKKKKKKSGYKNLMAGIMAGSTEDEKKAAQGKRIENVTGGGIFSKLDRI